MVNPHGQRRTRQRPGTKPSRAGERHELTCGSVGHGGFVVARLDGLAVFVRHALPWERVVVEVTEGREGDRFLRADAVEVLEPSAHRVAAPCPYAGPGACGGCDWQHAAPAYQLHLKAAVVREQLSRLAGLDLDVVVEEVEPVLGWRSRMQYVDLPGGRRGLRKHRSHDVVEIDDCLIDAGSTAVEGTASRLPTTERVETSAGDHTFEVAADGFWQPHVSAPRVLVETVLAMARPQPGEVALDLYAGAGLFAAYLADAVGITGSVIAVEGAGVAEREGVEQVTADVQVWLEAPDSRGRADLVVLDPPRTGAKRRVVEKIVRRTPSRVVYVACDPAALARDLALFAEHGYALAELRSFDLFPMTHHVECVALLTKTGSDLR